MKGYYQPSGLHRSLELLIDPHWSPEQAMAIVELLDDLRDRIWAHYEMALAQRFHEDRVTRHDVVIDDPPF